MARTEKMGSRSVRAYQCALLLWVGATAVFFYTRFSFAFVFANLEAIRSFLGR